MPRGAAACYGEPDPLAAQSLEEAVYLYNCRQPPRDLPPLDDIVYRSSDRDRDIIRHVFRWDRTPYHEHRNENGDLHEGVFRVGFTTRRQCTINDSIHYSLELSVNHGRRPLDTSTDRTPYAFVSTSLSSGWHPRLTRREPELIIYRYEIYAPGGIIVRETLGDRYRFRRQEEIAFIGGIAPRFVRSAQRFRLTRFINRDGTRTIGRHTRRVRMEADAIAINRNFDPQINPEGPPLPIQRPIVHYIDRNNRQRGFRFQLYPPPPVDDHPAHDELRKREAPVELIDYYTSGVADKDSYIDSAFRSATENEVYFFMKNEYVLVKYTPGPAIINGQVVQDPRLICDGFQSLVDTAFGEHGIDCAFGCPGTTEAFIFSGKLCAKINTTEDKIVEGPTTIAKMFPFFKGTDFAEGCDAAFESSCENEAYIFKGKSYACIDYARRCLIGDIGLITDGFPSLKDTIFASDIGAAFASHQMGAYYFFKDEYYTLVYFTPGAHDDYVIEGVKNICPNWPFLSDILPRKNRGVDIHDHPNPPEEDEDEDCE